MRFGCQELSGFQRGGTELRGLNLRSAKRRRYVDIVDIKRRIWNNEADFISLVMRLGWPKEEEGRIAVVGKLGKKHHVGI